MLNRVSDILNLFSEDSPTISLSDVGAALRVSQATAYRYLHDLHEMRLLSRLAGRYAPGPIAMELAFILANSDPVLPAAREVMEILSTTLGVHTTLCRAYQDRVVNMDSARPRNAPDMLLRPGRQLPLFRGAQARIVLAHRDRRRQRRIFERSEGDADRNGIGSDWATFSAALQKSRREGYCLSRDEAENGLSDIAAPIFDENREIMGAISLSYPTGSPPVAESRLIKLAKQAANDISQRVAERAKDQEGRSVTE